MASVNNLLNVGKGIAALCTRIGALQIKQTTRSSIFKNLAPISSIFPRVNYFHTSSQRYDLMEFFDDKKNWGQNEVKSGRSWTKDELRIKSNVELHKLWYVLLKEKNMLLTMEHECKEEMELFPSPERIDKVTISMENLESVVRERNRAYYLLHTGVDGERPGKAVDNALGMRFFYRYTEHLIPKWANKRWKETHHIGWRSASVRKFRKFYREKLYLRKLRDRNLARNHVQHLLQRYPNISKNLLRERYPQVDLDKLIRDDKCRGHFQIKE